MISARRLERQCPGGKNCKENNPNFTGYFQIKNKKALTVCKKRSGLFEE